MATKALVLILLALVLSCGPEAPASDKDPTSVGVGSPLEGPWIVSEITNYPAPQPGYLLFVGRYYSLVRINLEYPRPALEPYDSATVEGLRAVWGPFTAHSGTYEMKGSTITFSPLVAKNPQVMVPGNQLRSTARLLGDSLWITDIPADTVTVPNPNSLTYKYVRVR